MNLGTLKYATGSKHKPKRVGRGPGSGHGGTACRGHKGQHSRSGDKRRAWFEGGQTPIQRRLPKRGFNSLSRREFQIVNLDALNRLEGVTKITPELLYEKKLIRKRNLPVKILGDGQLSKALEVSAHAFSKSAAEKIESIGGKTILL